MCDYSLQAYKSRPAVVADKLETKKFGHGTTGFVSQTAAPCEADADVAVCVLPGTEMAFDAPVVFSPNWETWNCDNLETTTHTTAIFRQVEKGVKNTYHDQLEFPDGSTAMLTRLVGGQKATVLQLPATPMDEKEVEEQIRAEYV